MMQLNPIILRKNGKEEFVVLPYEEFLALQALIADVQDLLELRHAKQAEGDADTVRLEEVMRRYGMTG